MSSIDWMNEVNDARSEFPPEVASRPRPSKRLNSRHNKLRLEAVDDRVRTRKANSENARMERAAWEHKRHFSPSGSPKIIIGLIVVLVCVLLVAAIPIMAAAT